MADLVWNLIMTLLHVPVMRFVSVASHFKFHICFVNRHRGRCQGIRVRELVQSVCNLTCQATDITPAVTRKCLLGQISAA